MKSSVTIKTDQEIEKMRIAGKLAAEVLDFITPHVRPGVSTEILDQLCHDYICDHQQAIPAPLNYHPPGQPSAYPKSICTSVNHVICHGIPGPKKLKKGDIVNIDVTVIKDGYHGDTSRMFLIGETRSSAQILCQKAYEAMWKGIATVAPGRKLSHIGKAIEDFIHPLGYSIVQEFCGHGIGKKFHEAPQVLHYYSPKEEELVLQPGMTFTIEPMINLGKRFLKILPDGWTAVTKDRSLSAQWEHTILVRPDGYEVLTLSDGCQPKPF